MNPKEIDGWDQLDQLTERENMGIDVFGRIIGPYRVYALQSEERIELFDARTLVAALEQSIEIQFDKNDKP